MRRNKNTVITIVFLHSLLFPILPVLAQTSSEDTAFETAEGVVTTLYNLVSPKAGTTVDWDRVKSMFIDEAIIVLRTSRTATTVFSVEGFVNDFITFIEQANIKETGFNEKILRKKSMVFGDMAHVLVLYEAHIPGSQRPPQKGGDSFQLIRKQDRWWIVSITNEIPTSNRPIPEELQN